MPKSPEHSSDLLDSGEIAALLGCRPNTVHVWHHNGVLPSPVTRMENRPLWKRREIALWAFQTGRLKPTSQLFREVKNLPMKEVVG